MDTLVLAKHNRLVEAFLWVMGLLFLIQEVVEAEVRELEGNFVGAAALGHAYLQTQNVVGLFALGFEFLRLALEDASW